MIHIIVNGIYPNIKEYVDGVLDYFNSERIRHRFFTNRAGDPITPGDVNIIFSGKKVEVDKKRYNILFEMQHNGVRHPNNPPSKYSQFVKVVQMFKDNTSKNSTYFPLCYSKYFEGARPKKINEDKDVIYFGSLVDYKKEFINKFSIPYYKIYGEERDKLIYRTKVNLMIDRWKDNYAFAPLHAFLSWCKGKIVLVQKCPHYEVYGDYVVEFTEDTFLDVYDYWLHHDNERIEFGHHIRKSLINQFNLKRRLPKLMKEILP